MMKVLETELTQDGKPNQIVASSLENIGVRLTLTFNGSKHDISMEYEQTDQWYDNSKGQLGTLGANGGYDKSQEYNREKWFFHIMAQ